ncbi:hypothetical protein SAMN02799631_05335 [Methylobacterium sp. 174MFSha1.1]|uniref:hypothetical protein n=1 Tax=Methylobacterium sp. 174MFSha1.1 TaxID=1502749 RepID=UPI0008E7B48B|nr:hypothetical protein [Methylobacterium sp. 174MFSha1.1]SFV11788.1 hypothetical protein SAMN02799631_05335 [Methylobacterium sp. 174MFSha1.1]
MVWLFRCGWIGACLAAALSLLWPVSEAHAGSSTARTQHLLDAMTRHDLCARDDAGLKRLHHALSKPSAARAGATR